MRLLNGAEFYVSKITGRGITDYSMISKGDKIAVAVSGGKDSMALLKILKERQKFVPVKYELLAIHVDLGFPKSFAAKVNSFCKKLGVACHIEKRDELSKIKRKDINCFWCSWNRRKALFETANRLGYRKIAMGHHKDDIAQTILMNMFFQGEISAMGPNQEMFKGLLRIIRPFVYVDESLIKRYVRESKIPHINCRCPRATVSSRNKVAAVIGDMGKICPEIKTNIFNSVNRVKKDYLL